MKNWKIWILTDRHGNELARGRKREVLKIASQRYVYQHIFDDCLYRTENPLMSR